MRGIVKLVAILVTVGLGLFAFVFKTSAPPPEIVPPEPVTSLTLYFANWDASALQREQRQVRQTATPARQAVEELLAGTNSEGMVAVIPAGTRLRGFSVRDGVAYVDLSDAILQTPNRGSAVETLIVSSLVNTLTEFSDIEQVRILIEGKEVETLYGHMDLSEPLRRS